MDGQSIFHDLSQYRDEESKGREEAQTKTVDPIVTFLLQDCFWNPVDAGIAPEQTPLLTCLFEGNPLADTLCRRFGISVEEAEFEISAARNEVEL
jgi:hypothetical protein